MKLNKFNLLLLVKKDKCYYYRLYREWESDKIIELGVLFGYYTYDIKSKIPLLLDLLMETINMPWQTNHKW